MAPKDLNYLDKAYQRELDKKTHVSFPQLKYPSLRDEGLRTPVQWLTGKRLDDGAEGLWRVNNGIYDLTDFVKRHPGGAEWLELSKGLDITEAFESHHMNDNVEKLLKKFYVREAKTPRNSPFTFEEDGFYRSLKKSVKEELKKISKSVPRSADMIIDGLFITLLVSSALSCSVQNYWLSTFFCLVASVSLCWVVIASHNYIHRRTNWRMYLFNLSLWSYRDFRVSHVLSHHMYPNTLMDLEISAFEPLVWWNPRRDKPGHAKFTLLIECVVFPFAFLSNFIKRFMLNFIQDDFFTQHCRWHDALGFALPIWMYLVSGSSFYSAVTMWLWILCGGSFCFFTIGSNAAHHHPNIFKDGDQVRGLTVDWGMHELEAVMDRKDINGNLFKVLCFFGDHALHHLFPTLDHAVLPYLYPVFLEHCERFRANFRVTTQLDLFTGQLKSAVKTVPNLLEDEQ